MKTFVIDVRRRVVVTIDETRLQPRMAEFNECISDFGDGETAYEQHARNVAVLAACGIHEFRPDEFIDGYGRAGDAGLAVCFDDRAEWVGLAQAEAGAA